jgi:hypothetical protein
MCQLGLKTSSRTSTRKLATARHRRRLSAKNHQELADGCRPGQRLAGCPLIGCLEVCLSACFRPDRCQKELVSARQPARVCPSCESWCVAKRSKLSRKVGDKRRDHRRTWGFKLASAIFSPAARSLLERWAARTPFPWVTEPSSLLNHVRLASPIANAALGDDMEITNFTILSRRCTHPPVF